MHFCIHSLEILSTGFGFCMESFQFSVQGRCFGFSGFGSSCLFAEEDTKFLDLRLIIFIIFVLGFRSSVLLFSLWPLVARALVVTF